MSTLANGNLIMTDSLSLGLQSAWPNWDSVLDEATKAPVILLVDEVELNRRLVKALLKTTGYEILEEKTVGSTLLRRTCISFNSDLPLRWRFYFYKTQGAWKLVDLRVDDGLVELFEESIRPRK